MIRRGSRGRALLAVGATAAAILCAEGILRLAVPLPALATLAAVYEPVDDPALLFRTVPGASHTFERDSGSATVTIDPEGARAMPAGDADCPTLWVAGDSYAFGWGVDDLETWAALLQESAHTQMGCRPEVVNLAVGGYHLGQITAALRGALTRRPAPKAIAVHVAANDGMPDINWAAPTPLPRSWVRRSHLLRVINLIVVSRAHGDVEEDPEQEGRLQARLEALGDLAREREVPLWFVWQPGVGPEPRLAVQGFTAGEVDLGPCNQAPSMHLSVDDDHYSAAGHRCVAELVGGALLPSLSR